MIIESTAMEVVIVFRLFNHSIINAPNPLISRWKPFRRIRSLIIRLKTVFEIEYPTLWVSGIIHIFDIDETSIPYLLFCSMPLFPTTWAGPFASAARAWVACVVVAHEFICTSSLTPSTHPYIERLTIPTKDYASIHRCADSSREANKVVDRFWLLGNIFRCASAILNS